MVGGADGIARKSGKCQKNKAEPIQVPGVLAMHPFILRWRTNPPNFFCLPEYENGGYTLFSYAESPV
jgi:hypothetical protein